MLCCYAAFSLAGTDLYGQDGPRDLMSDTWVATDALGRSLPVGGVDAPLPKKDRNVLIFYFLWHNPNEPGPYDLSKILAENPDNPRFGENQRFHHWGEPELGYYVQPDEFLYRRHVQMLSVAGVDVLAFDVTNALTYKNDYLSLLGTMRKMNDEGNRTQQATFLLNSHHEKTAMTLYRDLYSPKRYEEFWFRWGGKPLMMCDPAGLDKELLGFFNFRRSWAWTKGHEWFGDGRDRWPWLDNTPQQYGWHEKPDEPEQICVCVAQHPTSNIGRSYSNGKQPSPEEQNVRLSSEGVYFSEQWRRALQVDPPVLFITGWNEWIAQRFLVQPKGHDLMTGKKLPVGGTFFVDAYNLEYNRDIEPMQGGSGDAYYYQMVAGIRKYKGARAIPKAGPEKTIELHARFESWGDVRPDYYDAAHDTTHRNAPGWGQAGPYVDVSGRNDLVLAKVARDTKNLFFYLQSRDAFLLPEGEGGLVLLIDADKDPKTGFNGYDAMVVISTENGKPTAALERLRADGTHDRLTEVPVHLEGDRLELAVPRERLGLTKKHFEFDFHWIDNIDHRKPFDPRLGKIDEPVDGNGLGHPGFPRHGDSAPDRRFNYRFKTR